MLGVVFALEFLLFLERGVGRDNNNKKCLGSIEERRPVSWGLAPQQPWIYSGTIRENILLGLPFDATRYHEVVTACCLQADLNALTHGDMTRVGDRGVALSGGQRARVGLARLCYAVRKNDFKISKEKTRKAR